MIIIIDIMGIVTFVTALIEAFARRKKQPAICESRVPQKEKRNAFRAAFNGKMFCLFRGSCNCPERKMQKPTILFRSYLRNWNLNDDIKDNHAI